MLDYIVVGWGWAGVNIAHQLDLHHASYKVIDAGGPKASTVAGGVINPLILKRFTKSWKADEFIPKAIATYRAMEEKLAISFVERKPIYRKIKSVEEQNNWFVASDRLELRAFMNPTLQEENDFEAPFKFGEVLQSFLVDTKKLLKAYREALEAKGAFLAERLDYGEFSIAENFVSYKGLKAHKIIFCEGIGVLKNPFFKKLPVIGNKGEFLIVKIPGLTTTKVIKTALALSPLGKSVYKFGATYSRTYKDLNPESAAEKFLRERLERLIDRPYLLLGKEVGIRPTVLDRRPLIGYHPRYKQLLICNGLGTHGMMMAPQLAEWLIDAEFFSRKIPEVADVQRYPKKEGAACW